MIQAAIFDMDGLMIDSERVWQAQWPSVLAKFNLEYKEGLKEACVASNGEVFEGHVLDFYPHADAAAIREELWASAARALVDGVDAKLGLFELIAWLKEHHIKCAVASASNLELIKHNLQHIDCENSFDALIAGEMVSRGKPFPDIFLKAAQALGADPAHTLVFEDSNAGIRAAAAGGFISVMIPDLIAPEPDVQGLWTCCCSSLLEARDLLEQGLISD